MTMARRLARVELRPRPCAWADDEPMTLPEYIAVFYPNGPLTISSLRTEIAKGRLIPSAFAGKFFVTPGDIRALLSTPCPVQPKAPASTYAKAVSIAAPAAQSQPSGSSEMDPGKLAQAATREALKDLMAQKRPSPPTSLGNTRQRRRQRTADVIPIKSGSPTS